MWLFKTKQTKIPTSVTQEVTEIESWKVEWTSYKYDFGTYGRAIYNVKVFIKEEDANELKKQLEDSAKFVNTTVDITKSKN